MRKFIIIAAFISAVYAQDSTLISSDANVKAVNPNTIDVPQEPNVEPKVVYVPAQSNEASEGAQTTAEKWDFEITLNSENNDKTTASGESSGLSWFSNKEKSPSGYSGFGRNYFFVAEASLPKFGQLGIGFGAGVHFLRNHRILANYFDSDDYCTDGISCKMSQKGYGIIYEYDVWYNNFIRLGIGGGPGLWVMEKSWGINNYLKRTNFLQLRGSVMVGYKGFYLVPRVSFFVGEYSQMLLGGAFQAHF